MKHKGYVLVVSLIFLMIMSMVAVFMFGGFTMDEKMSGNYREKNRSLEAAQAALNDASNWLGQPGNVYTGVWNTGITCGGGNIIGAFNSPTVCSDASNQAMASPNNWYAYYSYTPPASVLNVDSAGGIGNYAMSPKYYIQYVGTTSANPPSALYAVDAEAVGGNTSAVTVVRAVYQVTSKSRDIGGG